MDWTGATLLSALALSLYDIGKKHSAAANKTFPTLLCTTAAAWIAAAAGTAAAGRMADVFALDAAQHALLAAKSCIVASSWTFAYMALKTMPLTVMAPIRATGPVWTLAGAMAIYGETPGAAQSAGFALSIAGCIAFSTAARREGYALTARPVVLAACATLAGSVSALFDKFLMGRAGIPPHAALFWFTAGMTAIYAAATATAGRLDATRFSWRWTMPATGALLAASDFFYFSAAAAPDARISVISVVRRSSVALTFLAGGAIFRESNLLRKGLALAAILAGVAVLCIAR